MNYVKCGYYYENKIMKMFHVNALPIFLLSVSVSATIPQTGSKLEYGKSDCL